MSAAKAAASQTGRSPGTRAKGGPVAEIAFAAVIVDGRLFEFYLDEHGAPAIGELSRSTLLWRNPVVGMPHTIVHVLTVEALGGFVHDAWDATEYMLHTLDSAKREVARVWASRRQSKI